MKMMEPYTFYHKTTDAAIKAAGSLIKSGMNRTIGVSLRHKTPTRQRHREACFTGTLIAALGGGLVIGVWLMNASHSGFLGLLFGFLMFFPAFLFQISFVQWIFSLLVKRQLHPSLFRFVAYNMLASAGLVLAGLAAVSLFPDMDWLGLARNPDAVSPLFYSVISTIMRLPGAVSVIVLILGLGGAGYGVWNCSRLLDTSR